MKISIVTISYNQAPFLEQAICSVLDQSYPEIEYIVVDPGSEDGSRDIIEKYQDKIAHIILEPDDGPADGLNKGFELATGEIYGYLNADDFLLPGAVLKVVEYFQKHRRVDVLSGHIHNINRAGDILFNQYSRRFSLQRFVSDCDSVMQPATFFLAEVYKKTNGFNKKNSNCWDTELILDMANKGAKFRVINQYLASFRLYSDSISGNIRMNNEENSILELLRENMNLQFSPAKKKWVWFVSWTTHPLIFILRIIDEFVHWRKRRVGID